MGQRDTPGGVMASRRVNLHIAEEFAQQIEAHKPRSLALSAFCALLIEEGLTGGVTYPRTVSVRESPIDTHQPQAQLTNEADLVRSASASEKSFKAVVPPVGMGDGVGRESEGTPRKGTTRKPLPGNLLAHEDLILDFWKIKGGSKGDRAWSLLLTELIKLQTAYGDAVVRQQIELAINGKWKGITEANYTRFLPKGDMPTQANTRKSLADLQAEVDAWPKQSLW
jgi:hypothetical protein